MAVTKSGTGTWGLRHKMWDFGMWDARTGGRKDSGIWDTKTLGFRNSGMRGGSGLWDIKTQVRDIKIF